MPTPRLHDTPAQRQAAYRARLAREKEAYIEPKIPTALGSRRWKAMRKEARTYLVAMYAEQQAYYEAKSERWQESEAGENLAERIQTLETALEALEALQDLEP